MTKGNPEILISAAARVCQGLGDKKNIGELLENAYGALSALASKACDGAFLSAGAIRDSVSDDYIVCLEDGKKLKMLKRYLKTKYGMTEAQYRAKWGLPPDYPMVAPGYAKRRSALARRFGFGTRK